ncbi:hypothetical protein WMY93_002448 [Mugilogobius chulae]|uniref:Uncharacterized protein n=1 Tax=Mugilogobius chulae TaxID=88201 RepID=A0AAW0PX71_9GOBI
MEDSHVYCSKMCVDLQRVTRWIKSLRIGRAYFFVPDSNETDGELIQLGQSTAPPAGQYEAWALHKDALIRSNQKLLQATRDSPPSSRELVLRTQSFTYESDHLVALMLQDLQNHIHKYQLLTDKYRGFLDFLEQTAGVESELTLR